MADDILLHNIELWHVISVFCRSNLLELPRECMKRILHDYTSPRHIPTAALYFNFASLLHDLGVYEDYVGCGHR